MPLEPFVSTLKSTFIADPLRLKEFFIKPLAAYSANRIFYVGCVVGF